MFAIALSSKYCINHGCPDKGDGFAVIESWPKAGGVDCIVKTQSYPKRGLAFTLGSWEVIFWPLECPIQVLSPGWNRTIFICLRGLAIRQSVNVLYDRGFGTSSDLQELETEGIRSTSRMDWRLMVGHVSSMCPWWQEIKVLRKILDTRGSGELPWWEIIPRCWE